MRYNYVFCISLAALLSADLQAQSGGKSVKTITVKQKPGPFAPYRPSRTEMLSRYRKAAALDSTARNLVYKTGVQATWLPDGESFWYRNTLKDSVVEYVYVNAATGVKQKAFDHSRLAQALTTAAGKPYDVKRLSISNMVYENNGQQVRFQSEGKWWSLDMGTYQVVPVTSPAGFPERNDSARRIGVGRPGG